jgi:hypothetical protein
MKWVLPSFLNPNGVVAGAAVQVPPPPGFVPLHLPLKAALMGDWTRTKTKHTPAQLAGLRYEKRVHAALREAWSYKYHESQAFKYVDQRGAGGAIPDGLIKDLAGFCIIEIKSQHMPESWWQLRQKYEPLVRWVWPGQKVILLEICRSLDAAMPYPEEFEIVTSIDDFLLDAKDGALGVMQWKL